MSGVAGNWAGGDTCYSFAAFYTVLYPFHRSFLQKKQQHEQYAEKIIDSKDRGKSYELPLDEIGCCVDGCQCDHLLQAFGCL